MHISVGAVIYNSMDNDLFILLMHRKHTDTFHFCKGTQESGETHEHTVLREIKEETNCDVVIEKELGFVMSSFVREGVTIEKKTYYFSARHVAGIPQSNDGEHDTVDFYPLSEVRSLLAKRGAHLLGYEDEREILARFEAILL